MVWLLEANPDISVTSPLVPAGAWTGVLTTPSTTTLYQLSPTETRLALIPVPLKLALMVVPLQAERGPAGSLVLKRPTYRTLLDVTPVGVIDGVDVRVGETTKVGVKVITGVFVRVAVRV